MALNNDFRQISIHALLAESDTWEFLSQSMTCAFLSTLSLRRATRQKFYAQRILSDFYPRSPCGERHPAPVPCRPYAHISIHALLAESDETYVVMEATKVISIHALLAESDQAGPSLHRLQDISIHALLVESDQ